MPNPNYGPEKKNKRVNDPRVTDNMLNALIQQESGGDPQAVSSAGARGLVQAMPQTAQDPGMGVEPLQNPMDPEQSKRFGRDYMEALLKRFNGDPEKALAAYNWGIRNVENWSGKREDLPEETQGYLKKLLPVYQDEIAKQNEEKKDTQNPVEKNQEDILRQAALAVAEKDNTDTTQGKPNPLMQQQRQRPPTEQASY